jgi:hypothetical protein
MKFLVPASMTLSTRWHTLWKIHNLYNTMLIKRPSNIERELSIFLTFTKKSKEFTRPALGSQTTGLVQQGAAGAQVRPSPSNPRAASHTQLGINIWKLKYSRAQFFKLLRSSGNHSKEPFPPGCVCNLAGCYDNPIPTRFLTPIVDQPESKMRTGKVVFVFVLPILKIREYIDLGLTVVSVLLSSLTRKHSYCPTTTSTHPPLPTTDTSTYNDNLGVFIGQLLFARQKSIQCFFSGKGTMIAGKNSHLCEQI